MWGVGGAKERKVSDNIVLQCEPRERSGKGGSRALRRQGWVPAIMYGGNGDPVKLALFQRQIKRELDRNPRFFSSIVELEVAGKKQRAMVRECQLHPVNDMPLHVDLIRVTKGDTLTVEVPVNFLNEEACPGIRRGGVLNIVRREIEVTCPAEAIPEYLEVDLAECEIGDSVHISAVTLPANVQPTITDRDFTICTIVGRGPTAEAEEGEEGEGEAEAAEE